MQTEESPAPGYEAYRFDSFEVSIRQRMLRQGEKRLNIQELPFNMLLVLLEKPGEVVSKEELAQRLWGQGTFIEVDKSLYVMAAKLRDVLGDNPTQPRFIKTVSGRGYRFVGRVTPVLTPPAETPLDIAAPVSQTSIQRNDSARNTAHIPQPRALRIAVWGSLLASAIAVVGFIVYLSYFRPLASDQDRVVVGGFINSTGNPDLDRNLSSAVQLELQESPYLSLISNRLFRGIIKDANSASLHDELSACTALQGQLLLNGRVIPKGQEFQVELMAWRCSTGRLLTTQRANATSEAAIPGALDQATERMRRRLGESASSIRKFNVPLVQATTASLVAMKAFTLGEEKHSAGESNAAIASFNLAVDLDPQFALAYARLGSLYENSGRSAEGRHAYQKAFELRERTSDREKLYILTHYYESVTGETMRAIEDYELWRTLYPRDVVPMNNLAGSYLRIGRPRQALELARRAIQLDPEKSIFYLTLTRANLKLGDYGAVRMSCDNPVHGTFELMSFHRLCFFTAFALKDEIGMAKEMKWAQGNPEEYEALDDAAWLAMSQGKISEGTRLFGEAKKNALRNNSPESAADVQLDLANLEADFGLRAAAQNDALGALGLNKNATELAFSARALARVGDIADAQTEAKSAASLAPLDTIVSFAILPSVRAAMLLDHDAKAAVDALNDSRPYDDCTDLQLSPAYYRGLAYLQAGETKAAVAEFQQVIDHRSLAEFPVYVSLSKLEMGHAFQILGNNVDASRAFDQLDEIWKNADQDFPPLQRLRVYEKSGKH
jgi:DNA-binding winged helix-turn-helix (wHTH) protein/tetratricopeptide (TPR) repeat protein